MLAGGLVLGWFAFRQLGDGDLWEGVHKVMTKNKDHLNAIGGARDLLPFSTLFTGMLLINIYYWGMEQYIVQQALASRSLRDSQKGISLAGLGKLISPLLLNVPGLIALQLNPGMKNTAIVFPWLVGEVLPPVLAGFIAAVMFGAALSTFNAGLNSLGTLFVMNFYMPWARKKNQGEGLEKKSLRAGKQFQFLVIVLAICCSPYIMFFKGGFYDYLQRLASFFSVPVFTVMFVGLVTKRVPAIAAKTGLLFFVIIYSLTQFVFDTGLHYLHVLAILFVVTTILMLIIGKLRPLERSFVLQAESVVDLKAWKNRFWYFGVLIVLMVLMFVLFSPLGLAK
jgi:solute:Na+ symporter, SSS family